MLCQNCGRRSSDKLSFCSNCGAVASPDSPGLAMSQMSGPLATARTLAAPPRPSSVRVPQQREVKYRTSSAQKPAQSGSGFGGTIVFLAFAFGMAWWMTKTDDFDLFVFIRQAIESAINENQQPPSPAPQRPQPRPATRPAATPTAPVPPAAPPSAGRRTKDSVPAAGDKGATVPNLQYRGTVPPDIEGLTQAQVQQQLGAPTRRVSGGDGVNVWVYQYPNGGGTLIVYFYKDRASLKPPR
jgi:hypothetical protein